MAGSGKTILARKIEKEQGSIRFSPDEWIHRLMADGADKKENERLRDIVEAIQWETAQALLSRGVDVVLENGFWGKSERESYRDRARELGARVEMYFLDPPHHELLRRVEERNKSVIQESFKVSEADLIEWIVWFQKPTAQELKSYDAAHVTN